MDKFAGLKAFTGVVEELYGIQIAFSKWMLLGVPIAVLLLFLSWFYLVNIAYKIPRKASVEGGRAAIREQLKALGKISDEERKVLIVFIVLALAWMTRSSVLSHFIPNISDTTIGIFGAIVFNSF